MSTDPLAKQPLVKSLARTYGGDRDPWDRVEEYRRVRDYTAIHPQQGSAAVSTALELPRPRIRGWVDGNVRPDPMRAIDVADANGWLDLAYETPTFRALNVLVAWVFSGGAIAKETYAPSFAVDETPAPALERASEQLGVDYRLVHADDPHRATEYRIQTDASVLGRLLSALGAPVGPKNGDTDLTLPRYLDEATAEVRLDFARVYVRNRLTRRPGTPPAQVQEARSPAFKQSLADLIAAVVGDRALTASSNARSPLFLTERAVAILDTPPSLVHAPAE